MNTCRMSFFLTKLFFGRFVQLPIHQMKIKEILQEITQCYFNNDLTSDLWYPLERGNYGQLKGFYYVDGFVLHVSIGGKENATHLIWKKTVNEVLSQRRLPSGSRKWLNRFVQ